MVEANRYYLPPTKRMPNSPYPLLHYPRILGLNAEVTPSKAYDIISGNGWQPRWLVRYGPTQWSHYHSTVHECMVVLSGTATIRFGVADIESDETDNTPSCEQENRNFEVSDQPCSGQEEGGIELVAQASDVFVLPAGLAHKTFNPVPAVEFKLLAPDDLHHVTDNEMTDAMAKVELSGFTMLGAYPRNGGDWDFAIGGESQGNYEEVWSVVKPDNDPILGKSVHGLCGQWH